MRTRHVSREGASRWCVAAGEVHRWMADRDYAGWDPFDFLASPWLRAATLGTRWGGVALTQLGRRLPLQLRPLLGVPRLRNAKGVALVVESLLRLERCAGDPALGREARRLTAWLLAEQGPEGGWGYPFPWANRSFRVPAGTPSSVVTAFVGQALMDAADAGVHADGVQDGLDRAGTFLLEGLGRSGSDDGPFCFSYTPADRRFVHNASVLAAAMLARIGRRLGRDEALDAALRAARFTAQRQDRRGLWPYGLGSRDRWVDSYHTGYILVGLRTVAEALPGEGLEEPIRRGVRAWERTFLVPPAVGHRPGRPWPVDTHAVAHAILTLLRFDDLVPDARARAERLAAWAVDEMSTGDGRFHYLRHRRWTNRLAYMRWVQAWMLRALSELAARAAAEPAGGAPGTRAATTTASGREAPGEG